MRTHMDRSFTSQPQLPQRRSSYVGGAKPAAAFTGSSSRTLESSITLPQIAKKRPKTAFVPCRVPSGYQPAVSLEQKCASYPRERPKSALVRPLSGRMSSHKTTGLGWEFNGKSRVSVLDIEDFSDGDDVADVFGEDTDTDLQDLLTCSALNVEAKTPKPSWNVSDRVMPRFHCPRCRDHWYGLTPFPCDEVRAKLVRGMWQTGHEVGGGAEEKPKKLHRSKSAGVQHTADNEQQTRKPSNSNAGRNRAGEMSPTRREIPAVKANKQVAFKMTNDSIRQGNDIISGQGNDIIIGQSNDIIIGQDSAGTKSCVDACGKLNNCGNDGNGGDTIPHAKGGHDITVQEASLSSCDIVTTAPAPELTKQQDCPGLSPWEPHRLAVGEDRGAIQGNLSMEATARQNGSQGSGSQGNGSQGNGKMVPLAVSEERSQRSQPPLVESAAILPVKEQTSELRSGTPRSMAGQHPVPPGDAITTADSNYSDPTSPAPSGQCRPNDGMMPIASRNAQKAETMSRLPGMKVQVPPIPPRRHTIDVSDMNFGFKLTRPWTFTYHTSSTFLKKEKGTK